MDITACDGHTFTAYRAEPAEAPKAAVIVLHEIFGINADIRQTADALAKLGYLAVAPSLFDRVQKDVSLGYAAEAVQKGLGIVKQIPLEKSLADLQATVETVASAGKVGVLGFDWGAFVAFHAANRVCGLACAVAYYGAGITHETGTKRRIPTMLHFGRLDPYIPMDAVVKFRLARPDVTVYDYPAGHGFACADRDTYDADAAARAWALTTTLFSHRLVAPPVVTLINQGAYASSGGKDKKKKKLDLDEPVGM